MLKKRGIEALVGAALVVAMFAALPSVAEAQSTTITQEVRDVNGDAERSVVAVATGDSLWSISAQRLGADVTPQRIAKGVERIYALNQNQIGPDPNLIFAGQKLSVPAAMGGGEVADATAEPMPPVSEESGTTAAATSKKKGQADGRAGAVRDERRQASRNPRPTAGQDAASTTKAEEAPTSGSETAQLPEVADAAAPPVPAVKQVASEASAVSAMGESLAQVRAAAEAPRKTLGGVILVLTVVVAALMAWKLPMRRTTRWDIERSGMPIGYYGGASYHTFYSGDLDMPPTAEREESPQGEGSRANNSGAELPRGIGSLGGVLGVGRAKRRRRLSRATDVGSGRSVVRKGLLSSLNSAELLHGKPRLVANRRRRRRKQSNGGVRSARRRGSEGW